MGQRLNIEIEVNGETVANCYYHWSAYTTSAIQLTSTILQKYESEIKLADMPDTVKAIKCFEACTNIDFITGKRMSAGLSPGSYEEATKKYKIFKFNKAVSRNAGLIAITEEEMDNTRNWEEGRVEIDFTNEIVRFYVFWDMSIEDFIQDEEDVEEEPEAINDLFNIPSYLNDVTNIPFAEFDDFAKFVCGNYKFLTFDSYGNTCVTTRIE